MKIIVSCFFVIVSISSDNVEPKMNNMISILLLEEMSRNSMNIGFQYALHVWGRSKEKRYKGDKRRDKSK